MNHYERIAGAIRYLDEHHTEQPDLETLAQHSGLSVFHFHRVFSEWAGVTPKDFLQCLTVSHAKQLLRQGGHVLQAALDSGLSGPGRLHDLCVNLEAASPGELRSRGTGLAIVAGFAASPFGACLIADGPRGICHLAFVDEGKRQRAWFELRSRWPHARLDRNDEAAAHFASEIFSRAAAHDRPRALRAYVRGTAFQVRVWRALLALEPGTAASYGDLASWLGVPHAARAVGSAVARNPLAFLIPCHRVIRATGVIGDYRWGRARKRAMLAWESASAGDTGSSSST